MNLLLKIAGTVTKVSETVLCSDETKSNLNRVEFRIRSICKTWATADFFLSM